MKSAFLQTTSNDPLRRQEDGVADAKGKEGAGLAWSMHYARLDPALMLSAAGSEVQLMNVCGCFSGFEMAAKPCAALSVQF